MILTGPSDMTLVITPASWWRGYLGSLVLGLAFAIIGARRIVANIGDCTHAFDCDLKP